MQRCEQSNSRDIELVKTCDLCGSSKFGPELVANSWNLVRCNGCGLVFTSLRYTEAYLEKLYSDRYYERAFGYLFMQSEKPSKDEYHLAKSLMKVSGIETKGLKLRSLDVGCGGGRIVEAFRNSGWEAIGIDLSLKAVNAGMSRGLELRRVNLDNPELGDFDLITGFHILEHVHSPREFLSQCTKRLKSNGCLLIEVPDYGSRQASRMGSNWPYLYPDGHLYQFTIDTISKYMTKAKYEVIQIQKVQGRGFLEDYSTCPTSKPQRQNELKSFLFAMRYVVYWSPVCRRIVRHIFWNTLGYGEFIRIIARKTN
jgi:SAM-dependent methyltransferase